MTNYYIVCRGHHLHTKLWCHIISYYYDVFLHRGTPTLGPPPYPPESVQLSTVPCRRTSTKRMQRSRKCCAVRLSKALSEPVVLLWFWTCRESRYIGIFQWYYSIILVWCVSTETLPGYPPRLPSPATLPVRWARRCPCRSPSQHS